MKFENMCVALCVGLFMVGLISLSFDYLNMHDDIGRLENRINLQATRINGFFKENADECQFTLISKKDMTRLGLDLVRQSDNRPIENLWLYSCVNYKYWD